MCWSLASESRGMGMEEGIGVSNARSTNVVRGAICVKRGFRWLSLVLCGVFQGGLQVEVGDEAMEVVRMEAEKFGGLGEATLGLFQGSENEMFLGVAHGVVEFGGGVGNGQCAVGQSVREVFGKNQVGGADDDGALDGVLQFANVAGPIVLGETGTCRGRKSADSAIGARGVTRDEMVGEQRDVFGMLAKSGHGDGNDVEAIEEVEAEFLVGDGFLEVLVGGGDEADIQFDGGGTAETDEFAFLQDAKELGLKRGWQLCHFVEEDGSAFGDFEEAFLLTDGAGEGAAFVAEHFAFEKRFGESGAIECDEGARFAWTVEVDSAGGEFFPGAAFAQN